MSIQRGINQLLYTTAIAAGVQRREIDKLKEKRAEGERIKALETSLTPRKNAAGRNITPRAGSAESEANRVALKDLSEVRKKAFLMNPTEENRAAFMETQKSLNTLEERRALAMAKARQKIKTKLTQQEERKAFLRQIKGLPPEDQETFKGLSDVDRAEFAKFITGANAQDIVAKLTPAAQLQAFYQMRGK